MIGSTSGTVLLPSRAYEKRWVPQGGELWSTRNDFIPASVMCWLLVEHLITCCANASTIARPVTLRGFESKR